MRLTTLGVVLLGAASPLAAQEKAVEGRRAVAPDSAWSITDAGCAIDVGFGEDVGLVINPHDDHHDLGLYDPHMKGVIDQKVVAMRYGAGGTVVEGDYQALGHRSKDAASYVANVDEGLLDRVAAAGSLQVHRGKTRLADLDMAGFPAALAAMRACEAAALERSSKDAVDRMEDAADALSPQAEAAAAAAAAAADPAPAMR